MYRFFGRNLWVKAEKTVSTKGKHARNGLGPHLLIARGQLPKGAAREEYNPRVLARDGHSYRPHDRRQRRQDSLGRTNRSA